MGIFHSLLNFFLPCILFVYSHLFNKIYIHSSKSQENIILNGINDISNRTLSDSCNFLEKSNLRTSNNKKILNKNTTNVERNIQVIEYDEPKNKETLEDLLEEYDDEMNEINKTNEMYFYKRALLLLDVFDNIFIDKLVDMNIKKKHSSLVDHMVVNSAYLCNISPSIGTLISGYLIRRFEFLNRY